MTTAAREFLEARKQLGSGPALPREIYDGLVAGGLQFETPNEVHRLTGLRATLRKNSGIFHKLPNGQYGLLAWYPRVKSAKPDEESEQVTRRAPATDRYRIKTSTGPARVNNTRSGEPVGAEFDEFALAAMADGKEWNCSQLKQQAIEFGGVGVDTSTDLRSINVRLLGLMRENKIARVGKGVWTIAKNEPTAGGSGGSATVHAFKAVVG